MNVFARIESACARVVEDAFARVFPSALQPEQIGRRLIATAQASAGDLYLVRVHPSDYVRLAADRDFLEGRWSAMLREVLPSGAQARVVLDEDPEIVAGSLAIQPVTDERAHALALERPDGTRIALADGLTIGRAPDNAIVVRDPRVSRRHARILAERDGWAVEDAGSSNGTFVEGARVRRARLELGQTVTVGDTPLRVTEG
ncbi:MAG TPA: FhaA domain-containing protein [Candidatus Limnocylindria bacterium]|nr:FhaA domain-containing protein [Candidatus Limnocylindria bacterium]